MPQDTVSTIARSELRRRAVAFSARFADATSEASDRQIFWYELFGLFGIDFRQVAAFEELAKRASTGNHGWIDLLYPGQMAVEHKSAGEDLDAAMGQLVDYLPSLPQGTHPWLLVVCDFQRFKWKNLDDGSSGEFALADLADNLEVLWWIGGQPSPVQRYENVEDANLAATRLMATIHDRLRASSYPDHALREWLTRILFILFADDTGVWDRSAFHAYIATATRSDGADLGPVIAQVFQLLNTPPERRPPNLDEELQQFGYINGDLFAEDLPIPYCDAAIRESLLMACTFDWSAISPSVFGSMFQNVMTPAERRKLGAHYTTEENILRTIRPLFVDDLELQLERANSQPALEALHTRMAELTFFDPACGCGNFLVVAYRELRRIETELLRKMAAKHGGAPRRGEVPGQRISSLEFLCKVRVDQFYGIEIEEFPARIARTALYLIDHLANREVSAEFGEYYVRFPIPAAPHIVVGNALRLDWDEILPRDRLSYLFGNPPFAGQRTRAADQTADLRLVWGETYSRWLDYVTGWYRLAADYLAGTGARAAFVSTSSITQGEQVYRVWSSLLDEQVVIDFAHRAFPWRSEARGAAKVHVVIIGFSVGEGAKRKVIFDYSENPDKPEVLAASHINPYLVDAPDVLIQPVTAVMSPSLPAVAYGNKPTDGGHLLLEPDELPPEGDAAYKFIRRAVGTGELLSGSIRYCIWMKDQDPEALRLSSFLRNRVNAVREFRLASSAADTRRAADWPWSFFRTPQPSTNYIAIPRYTMEGRRWFTVTKLPPEVIATDAIFTAVDPDGFLFGILSSAMFTAWLQSIGGALGTSPRFSAAVVYNTFPLPQVTAAQRKAIISASEGVLSERDQHPEMTLNAMYDPLNTPPGLTAAHRALDRAVDKIFAPRARPESVSDRMRILISAYQTLRGELVAR